MAQEIGQLSSRIEGLRAENLHLSQEGEALLLERDQLRSTLTRIGELIQRASEATTRARGRGDGSRGWAVTPESAPGCVG